MNPFRSARAANATSWGVRTLAAVSFTVALAILPALARPALAVDPLAEDEGAGLTFMREEEKLAHDVYVTLGERWNVPVFTRIASAESRHASAVITLLDRYGLVDPAAALPVGQFDDDSLQALYDSLIEQGSESLAAALAVGALIEETDIADLDSRLGAAEELDVQAVYSHLRFGSVKHLRAFTRLYASVTGESYAPQVLDADAYADLLATAGAGRVWRGGRP